MIANMMKIAKYVNVLSLLTIQQCLPPKILYYLKSGPDYPQGTAGTVPVRRPTKVMGPTKMIKKI